MIPPWAQPAGPVKRARPAIGRDEEDRASEVVTPSIRGRLVGRAYRGRSKLIQERAEGIQEQEPESHHENTLKRVIRARGILGIDKVHDVTCHHNPSDVRRQGNR